jgi:hypothetical protein
MGLSSTGQTGVGLLNRALADYYRCPACSVPFASRTGPHTKPVFFRLGADVIGYGRLAGGDTAAHPRGDLPDALPCARTDAQEITLLFDPLEVVENLRRERYTAHFREEGRPVNDLARKVYYFLRPLLGVVVRRPLQRLFLRGWDKIPFPAWPVDVTVDRIHQKLLALSLAAQGLAKMPFIWFWPDGFSSCAIMTHDVEEEAGRDFCGRLMGLDASEGIASSFQIVPETRYEVTRSFLDSITNRGFEVNVHDLRHDGRLYAEHAEFQRRAQRINAYVHEYGAQGFRSGILYRNADWFDAFEFSYDMSLPNVAHLDPQRGGCCTVTPFFIGKIVELPVTCTQDYTLFQILNDYSLDLWQTQISRIRQQNGLISFIVHPDYIMEKRAQNVYRALLAHLARLRDRERVWMPLPRDVASWWRRRSQMELVQENGAWQIRGPGSERARVAFASLAGDTVTYSLAA